VCICSEKYSKYRYTQHTCEESITITFTPASANAANRVLSSGLVPIAAPHTSCLLESCIVRHAQRKHKQALQCVTSQYVKQQSFVQLIDVGARIVYSNKCFVTED
jgi:hypothetical protein